MAGYERRASGRPKVRDARQENRKKALNADLAQADSNTQRISAAAGYLAGAVARRERTARAVADTATSVIVELLVRLGDRLLAGGVISRDDYSE